MKVEESADETRRVEAATSPPSMGSPPRTRVRLEAAQGEEEEAEEDRQTAAEKAALSEGMRMPPASQPSLPQENPGRELFPVVQDPILPGAGHAAQQSRPT